MFFLDEKNIYFKNKLGQIFAFNFFEAKLLNKKLMFKDITFDFNKKIKNYRPNSPDFFVSFKGLHNKKCSEFSDIFYFTKNLKEVYILKFSLEQRVPSKFLNFIKENLKNIFNELIFDMSSIISNYSKLNDSLENSPLHNSILSGDSFIYNVLIEYGIKINSENKIKQTPIFISILKNDIICLKLLLKTKVDLNKTDIDGNTPLHLACYLGFSEIIDLLIKNGASVEIKNKKNESVKELLSIDKISEIKEQKVKDKFRI